jgi:hypothetical protein
MIRYYRKGIQPALLLRDIAWLVGDKYWPNGLVRIQNHTLALERWAR